MEDLTSVPGTDSAGAINVPQLVVYIPVVKTENIGPQAMKLPTKKLWKQSFPSDNFLHFTNSLHFKVLLNHTHFVII